MGRYTSTRSTKLLHRATWCSGICTGMCSSASASGLPRTYSVQWQRPLGDYRVTAGKPKPSPSTASCFSGEQLNGGADVAGLAGHRDAVVQPVSIVRSRCEGPRRAEKEARVLLLSSHCCSPLASASPGLDDTGAVVERRQRAFAQARRVSQSATRYVTCGRV
jgi:hypothetical protein